MMMTLGCFRDSLKKDMRELVVCSKSSGNRIEAGGGSFYFYSIYTSILLKIISIYLTFNKNNNCLKDLHGG